MKEKIKNFTDLKVWQEAHKLVKEVYSVTANFPKSELFGITHQIRRSAVSVTSNIAEGFSRLSSKEKLQFYSISHGSLTELENQIIIARDVGYLPNPAYRHLNDMLQTVHRLMNGIIKSTKSFKILNS